MGSDLSIRIPSPGVGYAIVRLVLIGIAWSLQISRHLCRVWYVGGDSRRGSAVGIDLGIRIPSPSIGDSIVVIVDSHSPCVTRWWHGPSFRRVHMLLHRIGDVSRYGSGRSTLSDFTTSIPGTAVGTASRPLQFPRHSCRIRNIGRYGGGWGPSSRDLSVGIPGTSVGDAPLTSDLSRLSLQLFRVSS